MSPDPDSPAASAAPPGGWITARPARGREVLERLVRLPGLVREYRDLVSTTLKRDLTALIERFNRAGDGTMVVPSEYLEIVVTRL